MNENCNLPSLLLSYFEQIKSISCLLSSGQSSNRISSNSSRSKSSVLCGSISSKLCFKLSNCIMSYTKQKKNQQLFLSRSDFIQSLNYFRLNAASNQNRISTEFIRCQHDISIAFFRRR